jgi:hypothetical protein
VDHPAHVAKTHDAIGEHIRAWGFQHYHEAINAALSEITAGHQGVVLGDADIALIAAWALSDRELPGGGTIAEHYAQRSPVRVISHDVSRSVRPDDMLVARIMEGPPAKSIWGPVGRLTRDIGFDLLDLLEARAESLGLGNEPGALASAMHAAAREITMLLAALARAGELGRAA